MSQTSIMSLYEVKIITTTRSLVWRRRSFLFDPVWVTEGWYSHLQFMMDWRTLGGFVNHVSVGLWETDRRRRIIVIPACVCATAGKWNEKVVRGHKLIPPQLTLMNHKETRATSQSRPPRRQYSRLSRARLSDLKLVRTRGRTSQSTCFVFLSEQKEKWGDGW